MTQEPESFALKILAFFAGLSGWQAYGAIVLSLLVSGLGVPIPEDITLVSAGVMAAREQISLLGAMVVGFFGVLLGDGVLFFLGRFLGERVFQLPGLRFVFTPKRVQKARVRVLRNSKFICFVARFLPGLRAPIYLCSGIMGVKPWIFLGLDGLAAALSVPFWVWLGWWFGNNIERNMRYIQEAQVWIFLLLILGIAGFVVIKKRSSRASETDRYPYNK